LSLASHHAGSGKSRTAGGWLESQSVAVRTRCLALAGRELQCSDVTAAVSERDESVAASWAWSRRRSGVACARRAWRSTLEFTSAAVALLGIGTGRPGGILFLTSSVLLAVSSRKRGPRHLPQLVRSPLFARLAMSSLRHH
jgi:hypothetical protein